MTSSRFDSPEASLDYMRRVAVKGSGFSNWLQVEPLKVWQGESELLIEIRPDMTQHHGLWRTMPVRGPGPPWSAMS